MHPVQTPAPPGIVFSLLPRARLVLPRRPPLSPWEGLGLAFRVKTYAKITREIDAEKHREKSQNEVQNGGKSGPKPMKNRARKPTLQKTRKYAIFTLRGDPSTLEINGFTQGKQGFQKNHFLQSRAPPSSKKS